MLEIQKGMKVLLAVAVAYYLLLALGTQWVLRQNGPRAVTHRVEGRRLEGGNR